MLIESLGRVAPEVDAVIVLDQVEQCDCGAVTRRVRESLPGLAQQYPDRVFWADSRCRIREFQQVLIKPNQFEAVGRPSPLPDERVTLEELLPAAQQLELPIRHRSS